MEAIQSVFDPKIFLAKVDGGRTIAPYRINEIVFAQGDRGDAVFYIQQGKIMITVTSERGTEAVVAILGADDFFGEGCLGAQPVRLAAASTAPPG